MVHGVNGLREELRSRELLCACRGGVDLGSATLWLFTTPSRTVRIEAFGRVDVCKLLAGPTVLALANSPLSGRREQELFVRTLTTVEG